MRPAPRQHRVPLRFPPVDRADDRGLLCAGGDLGVDRLLLAYSSGIFPWYGEGLPILWWSPDPRFVLMPRALHVSRRLRRVLRQGTFEIRADTAFEETIHRCSTVPRRGQDGTWIVPAMVDAYIRLHGEGWAHSVEAWRDDRLVGGIYGVAIGGAFFGESMFALEPDASKAALAALCSRLVEWDFGFLDCQVQTDHMERMGARPMPRADFLGLLENQLEKPGRCGSWTSAFLERRDADNAQD